MFLPVEYQNPSKFKNMIFMNSSFQERANHTKQQGTAQTTDMASSTILSASEKKKKK